MVPRVSICLPNLNMLPFLRQRFDTIFSQTFQDWELFVYDSHSDDGAWEFIKNLARREPRMRISQGPREGVYPAWNQCIQHTDAELIYIATSDDTMAPDCLEKLVTALERNEHCDLAQCPLIDIDETGARLTHPNWPQCTVFSANGMSEMLERAHVRRAPYDGLLHLTGRHVYLSITQLLIRRSLFSRIGGFPSKWGSVSDFNWEMKAGLIANTVYVPDTWASWRVHPKQASAAVNVFSAERDQKVEEMIEQATLSCEAHLPPSIVAGLKSHWLALSREMRKYYASLRQRRSVGRRRLYQLAELFRGTHAARSELLGQLLGKPKWGQQAPTEIRLWLESLGFGPVLEPIPA